MGEEKQVTIMVLKVDLQCGKCHEKVKKVLYKIPYILDQTYDEKNNTVTIKVVCCSPEKVKEKIFCKGGGTIKSIETKVPEPPEKPKDQEKRKEGNPKEKKEQPEKPEAPKKPPCQKPPCQQCHVGYPCGPCFPVLGCPPPCQQCHVGYPCGRPPFDSCGYGRDCYMSRCDIQGCTFM